MQAINWVYCEDQLPDYGNSVLFCEATDLRIIHLGWIESGAELKDNEDMWFSESAAEWFKKNQILAWYPFPQTNDL